MSSPISPTAHYTGYVWVRNGLSHPELATLQGRALYESLRGVTAVGGALGRPTLEGYLLARHRAIDALLERAIESENVTQVVEVAAGLSPRGWRLSRRYGERLTYIEADLPEMAERKRRALDRIGTSNRHRVADLDALKLEGDGSLAELAGSLDCGGGLAIVTEGLLGYLPTDQVKHLWQRIATAAAGFPIARYISDLHLGGAQTPEVRAFRVLLSGFVRGRVHLHFDGPDDAVAALRAAGFAGAEMRPAAAVVAGVGDAGGRLAHIIDASIR
jgi:O-methyltransferase involved in polyketide biosynthesis